MGQWVKEQPLAVATSLPVVPDASVEPSDDVASDNARGVRRFDTMYNMPENAKLRCAGRRGDGATTGCLRMLDMRVRKNRSQSRRHSARLGRNSMSSTPI
eukprot:COSAG06_NODE_17357_length_946_cov_0.845336_1_plen_99_part_01